MLQQNSGLIEQCWVRFLVLRVGRIGGGGAVRERRTIGGVVQQSESMIEGWREASVCGCKGEINGGDVDNKHLSNNNTVEGRRERERGRGMEGESGNTITSEL